MEEETLPCAPDGGADERVQTPPETGCDAGVADGAERPESGDSLPDDGTRVFRNEEKPLPGETTPEGEQTPETAPAATPAERLARALAALAPDEREELKAACVSLLRAARADWQKTAAREPTREETIERLLSDRSLLRELAVRRAQILKKKAAGLPPLPRVGRTAVPVTVVRPPKTIREATNAARRYLRAGALPSEKPEK